jgi:hypothetical protein
MLGWVNSWNTIIRKLIWPDHELKVLMKIPPKTGILQFNQRYFIRAGYTNELLTDEVCRIIYADVTSHETDVPNVKKQLMTFDIYVKKEEMYNIGDDRLVSRLDLIVERLDNLLRSNRYLANTGYRFWLADGGLDLGTRTIGYARRTISYYYMKVM